MAQPHRLTNAQARGLFLARHQLMSAPSGTGRGADLTALIGQLGFVQVDSINTVARAHDHILLSRRGSYKPAYLDREIAKSRTLFEHWTHDAAIIPAEFFPYWRLKFERDAQRLVQMWSGPKRGDVLAEAEKMRARIAADGALGATAAADGRRQNGGGWWDWKPEKTALEYLWRCGELSICHRRSFRKVYDLAERVIPPEHLNTRFDDDQIIDWACMAALERLGFATSGEIAAFWDIITPAEAKTWVASALEQGRVFPVDITLKDGSLRSSVATAAALDDANAVPTEGQRLRILSPFDPALRDRKRAERLFGFDYRIEVFVPEAKRKYGYYVFPVLEGTRLVGRIDMKTDRKAGVLWLKGYWPESRAPLTPGRGARLGRAVTRMARFAGCGSIAIEKRPQTESLAAAPEFRSEIT